MIPRPSRNGAGRSSSYRQSRHTQIAEELQTSVRERASTTRDRYPCVSRPSIRPERPGRPLRKDLHLRVCRSICALCLRAPMSSFRLYDSSRPFSKNSISFQSPTRPMPAGVVRHGPGAAPTRLKISGKVSEGRFAFQHAAVLEQLTFVSLADHLAATVVTHDFCMVIDPIG